MKKFQGQLARVRCLAYAPDGETLASAGEGELIRIWDTIRGRCVAKFHSSPSRTMGLAYSPDGETLVAASSNSYLKFWAIRWRQHITTMVVLRYEGSGIEFSPDGQRLLTPAGGAYGGLNVFGFAAVWDLKTQKPAARFEPAMDSWCATFSPDGERIAIGLRTGGIAIWDPKRSPNGKSWLKGTGHWPNPRKFDHEPEARRLRFSPDGRTLAASASGSIYFYSFPEGRRFATASGHGQPVTALAFSPDGRRLASASHDGTVRFWNPESGEERSCYDWGIGEVDGLAFAPDGMTIAAGGRGGIVVWDVE